MNYIVSKLLDCKINRLARSRFSNRIMTLNVIFRLNKRKVFLLTSSCKINHKGFMHEFLYIRLFQIWSLKTSIHLWFLLFDQYTLRNNNDLHCIHTVFQIWSLKASRNLWFLLLFSKIVLIFLFDIGLFTVSDVKVSKIHIFLCLVSIPFVTG